MGKNVSVSYPLVLGGKGHSYTDGGRRNWWTLSVLEMDSVIKTFHTHPLTQPSTRIHRRSPRYRKEDAHYDKVCSQRGLVRLRDDPSLAWEKTQNPVVRFSSQFHSIFKWHHVCSLKLTVVRVSRPQELPVPPLRLPSPSPGSRLSNMYQHTAGFNYVMGLLCRC